MNIEVQSQILFGDVQGLKDWFLVHRLAHHGVDEAIAQAGRGSMPSATIDSDSAMHAWAALMTPGATVDALSRRALLNWMTLHDSLHQAEYGALGLGTAPDMGLADLGDEQQFYDWMQVHSQVHDIENTAAGVTT